MLKTVFGSCIALALTIVFSQNVFAVEILFESRQVTELSRGVLYVDSRMMTPNGMLDVHAVVVDVNQPYVTLAPVINRHSLGQKETTQNILQNAGAIAGINADFFGLAGNYSVHFGPMARDGQLVALNPSTNAVDAEEFFGAFLIDVDGNAFFRYMRGEAWLYINGRRAFKLDSYNTLGPAIWGPVVVDRHAIYNTSALQERFDGLWTVVVEENRISGLFSPGSSVNTPEDGFLIIMPSDFFHPASRLLSTGAEARIQFNTDLRIDFSRIKMAVGGGGIIMANGEEVEYGHGVFPGGRHPRSAVGVMADGRIILLAVDGRTHSIGVNRTELVSILRRFAVTDALSLDGGGSTTLVTSRRGHNHVVANTVSDGAQRRVVNALGVFDNSPFGAPAVLGVRPVTDHAAVNVPLGIEVRLEDVFGNHIYVEGTQDFTFVTDPAAGFWLDGRYVPLRPGQHTINAQYGDFVGSLTIDAFELGALRSTVPYVSLDIDGRMRLSFVGTSVCGRQIPIPYLAGLTVTPSHLGYFNGVFFTVTGNGSGHITAQAGMVMTFIPISVGDVPLPTNVPESTVFRDRLRANPGFTGFAGGGRYEFQIPARGSNASYGVVNWSDFVVVTLPSGGRAIPVDYWGRFSHDIRSAGARNVVVMLEEPPDNFSQHMEEELLHRAMAELAESGMRVFVVSRTANITGSTVRDNVRYINFSSGTPVVRFWTQGNDILWG